VLVIIAKQPESFYLHVFILCLSKLHIYNTTFYHSINTINNSTHLFTPQQTDTRLTASYSRTIWVIWHQTD